MKQKHYLAFDHGAGSGRAYVGTFQNGKLDLEEIHRFNSESLMQNGHSRWDFNQMQEEIKTGIKKALDQYESLESIAVDTWGVDFGLLDEKGELLELPVTYRDPRTVGMIDEIYNRIRPEELYRITGNQAAQYNSLFQLYSVKLRNPQLYKKIDSLLFMPDLLNYYLTGTQCSEYTISSTSQLLNPITKEWNRELMEMLELSTKFLNRIVFPGERIGCLRPDLCVNQGIDVIAVGAHDTASAVAAIPAGDSQWAFLSSGTWSLVGCELEKVQTSEKAMSDGFTNEGGVDGKIRFLQNVMGLWLLEESRKVWEREGKITEYSKILVDAERADAFRTMLNPDDSCFFNPENMITAIDDYCTRTNQPRPHNEGGYTRAIPESLALKYSSVINKLDEYREESIQTINIVGGGSQNLLLNQFTANATGRRVIAGPVESAAIGNILIQAIASCEIENLQQARTIVRDSFDVKEFFPEDMAVWKEYSI